MNVPAARSLTEVDPRLLTEAFRRARGRADNADIDSDSIFSAIIDEARQGARDIYSLVKAARAGRQDRAS
jgi:hypothetical protein